MLTGKIFEYMASGRPILVIGPTDGEVARVVGETGSGMVSGFDDLEALKANILSLYESFKKGALLSESREIEKYSRRSLSERLSQVLNETAGLKFRDYLAQHRIEEAKRLLADPEEDLRIEDIAERVGYFSKSSFNTTFRRLTGVTPSQFRSSNKA